MDGRRWTVAHTPPSTVYHPLLFSPDAHDQPEAPLYRQVPVVLPAHHRLAVRAEDAPRIHDAVMSPQHRTGPLQHPQFSVRLGLSGAPPVQILALSTTRPARNRDAVRILRIAQDAPVSHHSRTLDLYVLCSSE